MLHTKYQSCMLSSFRGEDFQRFCYYFPFGCHGNHSYDWNSISWTISSPKEHPCQVSSRLAQWFRRRRYLKKLWTTHDGRRTPDIGRSQKLTMSTLCSGELKRRKSRFPEFSLQCSKNLYFSGLLELEIVMLKAWSGFLAAMAQKEFYTF